MGDITIECPNCETENMIDIMKAEEGSKVLCEGCDEFIELKFEDKTPKELVEKMAEELSESLSEDIELKFKL